MRRHVRLRRVVARAALISALASVVIPGLAGSRAPSAPGAIDPAAFRLVDLRPFTTTTTPELDPAIQSAGRLGADTVLREPQPARVSLDAPRPDVAVPVAKAVVRVEWHYENEISWYGPGFYGNGGACGMMPGGLSRETVGVAHRTLPCGTVVTFRYNGRTVTTRVIDRGPYAAGRNWDMTRGLCDLLQHCFTGGGVYWKLGS
jgi:rare lipoprotein A